MAWTTPTTIDDGDVGTAELLNTDLRDNLGYLHDRLSLVIGTPLLGNNWNNPNEDIRAATVQLPVGTWLILAWSLWGGLTDPQRVLYKINRLGSSADTELVRVENKEPFLSQAYGLVHAVDTVTEDTTGYALTGANRDGNRGSVQAAGIYGLRVAL